MSQKTESALLELFEDAVDYTIWTRRGVARLHHSTGDLLFNNISVHINIFILVDRSMKEFFQKVRANWIWGLGNSRNDLCIAEAHSIESASVFNGSSRQFEHWNLRHTVAWDRQWSMPLTKSKQSCCFALLIMLFWVSVYFTNQSKDNWVHPDFSLLLRLRLENSTTFQRVNNAELPVAPQVLRRNRFWIAVLRKISKGFLK